MQGDALALPFEDGSFDAATVGFGVRNLDDLEAGLRELRRVLRPGGRLGVLEITRPRGPLRVFYSLWFDRIVPLLGRVLPGGAAYTYLPASVRRFPGPDELARLLERGRLRRRLVPARSRAGSSRCTPVTADVTPAIAAIREAPGLDAYLEELEERLQATRREPSRPRRRRSASRRSPRAASGCGRCSSSSRAAGAAAGRGRASRSSSCTWRRSSTTT